MKQLVLGHAHFRSLVNLEKKLRIWGADIQRPVRENEQPRVPLAAPPSAATPTPRFYLCFACYAPESCTPARKRLGACREWTGRPGRERARGWR